MRVRFDCRPCCRFPGPIFAFRKIVEVLLFLTYSIGVPLGAEFLLSHFIDSDKAWRDCAAVDLLTGNSDPEHGSLPVAALVQKEEGQRVPPCVTRWVACGTSAVSFLGLAVLLWTTKRELWELQPARLLRAHVIFDMLLAFRNFFIPFSDPSSDRSEKWLDLKNGWATHCSSDLSAFLTGVSELCIISSEIVGLMLVVDLAYQLTHPLSFLDPSAIKRRNFGYVSLSFATGLIFSLVLYHELTSRPDAEAGSYESE